MMQRVGVPKVQTVLRSIIGKLAIFACVGIGVSVVIACVDPVLSVVYATQNALANIIPWVDPVRPLDPQPIRSTVESGPHSGDYRMVLGQFVLHGLVAMGALLISLQRGGLRAGPVLGLLSAGASIYVLFLQDGYAMTVMPLLVAGFVITTVVMGAVWLAKGHDDGPRTKERQKAYERAAKRYRSAGDPWRK